MALPWWGRVRLSRFITTCTTPVRKRSNPRNRVSRCLCLQGERGVLLALQDAFVGKAAGDDFSITIPHDKAYGRHYPDRKQRLSRKKIDGGKQQTFRPGQVITLRGEHGPSPATVIKVGKFNIDVDSNHPLAGIDLTFDIQIVSVREASAEERAHGHAHGAGWSPPLALDCKSWWAGCFSRAQSRRFQYMIRSGLRTFLTVRQGFF